MMLPWALLASGKINMRELDGWAGKPLIENDGVPTPPRPFHWGLAGIGYSLAGYVGRREREQKGTVISKMNPVVHFEMPAEDRNRMAAFYREVFG
jgi:hypothetical protein